jgi:serine/threonine protein kinase
LLKYDFYAGTALYQRSDSEGALESDQILVKVYHTDRLGPIPLGWLGRLLCRRESHYLERLAGIAGVPQLLGRFGESGLIREFVPGAHLREWAYGRQERPPADFFPRLAAILAQVHARGMAHNDLSKPENVVVDLEGGPILIDFQIALGPERPAWGPLGWLQRRLLQYQQKVDRYHLGKLHRRYRPGDFTETEQEFARRSKGLILQFHGRFLRRPYRAVRHFLLRRFLLAETTAGSPPAPHLPTSTASRADQSTSRSV